VAETTTAGPIPAKDRILLGLVPATLLFIADQVSKWWVLEQIQLPRLGRIEISPIFDLTMVWNYGVSFGLLKAGSELERWGLVVLSGVISAVFAVWLARAERRLTALALGVVIGGALGNMVDRIRYGAVADFLDFSGLYFPYVFNVADAAITIGAAMLFIDLMFNDPKKARA
jgi:signal peptidase II